MEMHASRGQFLQDYQILIYNNNWSSAQLLLYSFESKLYVFQNSSFVAVIVMDYFFLNAGVSAVVIISEWEFATTRKRRKH